MDVDTPATNRMRWLTSPLVVGLSLILNVLQIVAGVYFYAASRQYRELAFYVHPSRASIVAPHTATDIHVLYHGREIEGGVTVAQISVWNRGSEAIRRESVLDGIRIVVRPTCPILRANIQKVSRSVTGISLDTDQLNVGVVPVSWHILEKGDGAVVQIMYAGTADSQISVEGTVEGQREIFALKFPGQIRSASEQVAEQVGSNPEWLIEALFVGGAFMAVLTMVLVTARRKKAEGQPWKELWVPITVTSINFLLFLSYPLYHYLFRPVPPFGY